MVKAVCTGSFDPVTLGHIDIFERASRMFDEVIVGVFHNVRKAGWLPVDVRVALIREATAHLPNVRAVAAEGLVSDFMKREGASVIVRGLRSVTDFEYEVREAQMIKLLEPKAETVFLLTAPEYSYVSSSSVREVVAFHGSLERLVPPCVAREIAARFPAET